MDYRKNEIKQKEKIVNLIKQNGYEIDCKLLNNMYELNYVYTYLSMMTLICCSNGNVYGKLSIENDAFIVKFKDSQSINAYLNDSLTKKDCNFDYNEENFIVNNHSFTIVYDYKTNGVRRIFIVDKDSRKLLIVIARKSLSINIDIFKFFNKSIYKSLYEHYKNSQKWIENGTRFLPDEMISIITKCQVLISLSS